VDEKVLHLIVPQEKIELEFVKNTKKKEKETHQRLT
jgi:hypothetical protein